ncbi:fumarylacetoacetase [Angustibacter sp. Root456]|uniref:fumarylacetoacetase n=1 Tax=Angustibacter sp. Root456 TaxID=1736539 RepID=UPI0006F2E442|nr:fumarylacetoacetase [Angustibacter sp. Root456]KQX65716.1 fumarylacetoacetase [Angustibacter sp. Root456]
MTAIDLPADSPYGLDHLPYGVFSTAEEAPRVGVRVGDHVLDAAPVAAADGLAISGALAQPTLNAFLAAGRAQWDATREWLVDLLTQDANAELVAPHLLPLDAVTLHLPFEVADYVDFYASEHHATNVGRIFRPDGEALTPNWKHLPIGYHGRAGTVVVSGTDVVRPTGQRKTPADTHPAFGPSIRLDIEAEVGFVVGTPSALASRVDVDDFDEHVFGVVLLNDWSARDIQAWEYVPLGPFLGKSFATSVSAWVTPMAALSAARIPLPEQHPEPLDYLRGNDSSALFGFDLAIEIELNGQVVARPPYRTLYWSPAQMLAHLTVNGASLRTGDLFASGTVSGTERDERGSLLELTWNGSEPIELADGTTRGFLEDGDTVVLRATAPATGGGRLALGEVRGTIQPAR